MARLRSIARVAACALLFCPITSTSLSAQTPASGSFLARWQSRATAAQEAQPHWATPVATSTPRIDQAMRAEFSRQVNTAGYRTWDLGNSKGLELIPAPRIELIFGVPPFFGHSQPGVKNGFGDMWFQAKYRLAAANEQHGNYAITAILYETLPTGKDANGICCATVTPAFAAGKGWGRWAFMTLLSGSLPASNAHGLGHTIAWSNVAEYRLGTHSLAKLLTPELETNSSFYLGGPNHGKAATFATPGLIFGRIPLSRSAAGAPGRRALTLAAGQQIALTRFHPANHTLILSARMPF